MKKVMNLGSCLGMEENDVWVLTNVSGYMGAREWVFSGEAIKQFLKDMNVDTAWIIPSSKHELLLVPDMTAYKREEMEKMHRDIQRTTVAKEDRLCDDVWYFDETGLHITVGVNW